MRAAWHDAVFVTGKQCCRSAAAAAAIARAQVGLAQLGITHSNNLAQAVHIVHYKKLSKQPHLLLLLP
jgi:hypothetical protein